MFQDIIAKGGSLTEVLQNLPSVSISSSGTPQIRGDDNVTILVNSKPSGLTSSTELFSTIPLKKLKS